MQQKNNIDKLFKTSTVATSTNPSKTSTTTSMYKPFIKKGFQITSLARVVCHVERRKRQTSQISKTLVLTTSLERILEILKNDLKLGRVSTYFQWSPLTFDDFKNAYSNFWQPNIQANETMEDFLAISFAKNSSEKAIGNFCVP